MSLEDIVPIEIGDIIQGVIPFHREKIKNQYVFCFYAENIPDIKGFIFPNDEFIYFHVPYDVIVKRIISKNTKRGNGRLVFSEPYHEFKVGDLVKIKVSGKTPTDTGKFSLYGYKGYVNDTNVRIGDKLTVKIKAIKPSQKLERTIKILETVVE